MRFPIACCFLLFAAHSIHCQLDASVPKNFTRSRFSWRNRPSTQSPALLVQAAATTPTAATVLEEKFLDIDNSTSDAQQPDCGVRIGENHPWIAIIEHTDPTGRSRKKTLSKGVLIDDRHVLTTVASVHNSHPFWTVSKVRLGDSPTWSPDHQPNSSHTVRVGVETIFNHRHRDIAIIRLAEAIPLRPDVIQPICLPPSNSYNYRELELHRCVRPAPAMVGARRPRVTSVQVQLVQPQDCSIIFRRREAEFTHDEFCAWDELGDTCTGDLGGPLAARWNGRHYVVGLSSYINVRDDDFVPSDYPGVYVRVGSHMDWIRAVLGQ